MSLERRLRLGLATSLVLLMTLLWWLTSAAVRDLTDNFFTSRLQHDGEDILVNLAFDAAGQPTIDFATVDSIYSRPFSGHYFVVFDSAEHLLRSRSLWDETLPVPPEPVGATRRWRRRGPRGDELVVWSGGYRKQGHRITIAVAESVAPINAAVGRYQWYYAALTVAVLVVLLVSQSLIVRRSFRPLGRLRADVRRLEQGEVSRLGEEGIPAEVRPLVGEVNRLLELLAGRLKRSRNALGNLAHTLKGPLTLLNRIAERPELAEHPELAAELRDQVERLRQATERELKRARLVGSGTPGSRFDPAAELPDLVALLRRIHHDKALAIDYRLETPGVQLALDRDDMLELLGNLLDNACKWAAGRVRCTVGERPVRIVVEDDGPGVAEAELDALTRRGTRVDEGTPGHGLGLAIVRDIAEGYGGTLRFDRSEEFGGLRVTAILESQAGKHG